MSHINEEIKINFWQVFLPYAFTFGSITKNTLYMLSFGSHVLSTCRKITSNNSEAVILQKCSNFDSSKKEKKIMDWQTDKGKVSSNCKTIMWVRNKDDNIHSSSKLLEKYIENASLTIIKSIDKTI